MYILERDTHRYMDVHVHVRAMTDNCLAEILYDTSIRLTGKVQPSSHFIAVAPAIPRQW